MGQWHSHTIPKCRDRDCSDELLVTVKTDYGKRVVKAVYFPHHHCTIEEVGCNMPTYMLEYSEKDNSWWIPEGWYEENDYFGDYCYSTITDEIIAWSKLQKPYEPRIKQMEEYYG